MSILHLLSPLVPLHISVYISLYSCVYLCLCSCYGIHVVFTFLLNGKEIWCGSRSGPQCPPVSICIPSGLNICVCIYIYILYVRCMYMYISFFWIVFESFWILSFPSPWHSLALWDRRCKSRLKRLEGNLSCKRHSTQTKDLERCQMGTSLYIWGPDCQKLGVA